MRLWTLMFLGLLTACKGDDPADTQDTDSCEIPATCTFSAAASGGLCQANLFCETADWAVYCGEEADGTYSCDCGPVAESPPAFVSDDICDLEGEARVCAAMAECTNWDLE